MERSSHKHHPRYTAAFEKFLGHTDEKAVLARALLRKLHAIGAHSLLDIGAGNGSLTFRINREIARYVAVEQVRRHAQILRDGGISVIEDHFPCDIEESFDVVLSSHSMPGTDVLTEFLYAAWSHVHTGGHLLIVTFEDLDVNDWSELVAACELPTLGSPDNRLQRAREILQDFGQIREETVTTYVRTDTIADMMEALAFVWSDGSDEHIDSFINNKDVREYVEAHYRVVGQYQFPFLHHLLDVPKY